MKYLVFVLLSIISLTVIYCFCWIMWNVWAMIFKDWKNFFAQQRMKSRQRYFDKQRKA